MKQETDGLTGFINRRLFFITLVSTLLAAIISALYTLTEFNISLKPRLLQKIEVVVQTVQLDVELAVKVGVPLTRIKGMDSYLEDTASKYPELLYIAVTDNDGKILYKNKMATALPTNAEDIKKLDSLEGNQNKNFFQRLVEGANDLVQLIPFTRDKEQAENYFLPLAVDNQQFGQVQVGLNTGFIRSQLTDVFFDIAIVLIAVLLVSFEIVMVLVMFYVTAPLRRSENLLKRQAAGDFTVNDAQLGQGSIELYNRQLNQDSMALQETYQQAVSNVQDVPQPLNEKLKKLAEKFNLVKVLKEKRTNVLDARIPLFVFAFAEELQKSFMPLFVAEYYEPNPWFTKDIMLGLPISIFMFVIAVATPFAGAWVDRWGNKKLFLMGLIPALAGYLGCAFATSSYDIIIWRGVTALGYAIITISCQGYIAAAVPAESRAKGMAIFVGVLMTATMSGTALGGIIADRVGYHSVFLISAVLTVAAGFLAWLMLSSEIEEDKTVKKAKVGESSGVSALFKNTRFVCLVLFCAIPAKIILTGFLYYLVPLYLVSLDATQSEIGRIMMVYALVIIPLSPVASQFADRCGKMLELVVLGTIISGVILISLYNQDSIFSMLIAIAMMGAAHSILKAPLIAVAITAAEATPGIGRTTVLGVLRTSERIGSVLGPLLVGFLLLFYNYSQTMAIIGLGIVVSGAIMAFYFLRAKQQESSEV